MQTWNADQLAWSNGAYAGRTITFPDPQNPGTSVNGILRRANSSSETPGNTLLLVAGSEDFWNDSDWYSVPNETPIEVAV